MLSVRKLLVAAIGFCNRQRSLLLGVVLGCALAAGCGGGGGGGSANSEPAGGSSDGVASLPVTTTFSANQTTISTSEGAPYAFCDFWTATLSQCASQSNFGYGPTTVLQLFVCLSGEVSVNDCSSQPAVTGPLTPTMLSDMDANFAAFEGTGVRLLVRFTYNFGPIGPTAMDASMALISEHLDQVAPILLKYQDLIFGLEAGFIGTWGEWHDSTNGNDTAAAHKAVLDKETQYFAGVFPILVRDADALFQYTGSYTPVAGLGIHDDYYDSGSDDAGTWDPCTGIDSSCVSTATTPQLESYGVAVSTTTMFVGEFGALAPAQQTCAALDAYSYMYHAQSITLFPYPADVGAELQNEGCALSFYNKVGTRIELQSATISGSAAPGGALNFSATLVNTGYGRVVRARPVTLVLSSGDTVVYQANIPLETLDLRQLQSAATPQPQTFQFSVQLPSSFVVQSDISAALLIPDPAPSLTAQAAYALPLNSVDPNGNAVFDPSTGLNAIGTIPVSQ